MGDGVVDEDLDQLAETKHVTVNLGGHGIGDQRDFALAGQRRQWAHGLDGDVGEVNRLPIELDRPGVRAREEQKVVHERRQVGGLGVDVLERGAHPATGSSWFRRRSVTLVRITVSGVRSSWLAFAANSRWRSRAASRRSIEARMGTRARPA